MSALLEPLAFGFFRQALLGVVLVGLLCGPLGVHIVHRRMVMSGDALAHATLPGLVLAHLLGTSLPLGGLISALVAGLAMAALARDRSLPVDTSVGVVFGAMLALGSLLMGRTRAYRDFTHLLFGNLLGITTAELAGTALVLAGVLACLVLLHRRLELDTVDAPFAASIGLGGGRLRPVLLACLALTVVVCVRLAGALLTTALLVTPGACVFLLGLSLARAMAVAALIAVGGGVAGLYLSYHANTPAGASAVLCTTAVFLLLRAGFALHAVWPRRR